MNKIVAALLAAAWAINAYASSYTGQVLMIQIAPSPTTANAVRISAEISGTTNCPYSSWYSAEFSDGSALGKAWIATLLAAQARGANITISGTGACDSYGLETIHYINSLP